VTGFDDAAFQALEVYAWPGNVRELQNIVERACALADGERVTRNDLPDYLLQGDGARSPSTVGSTGPSLPVSGDVPLKDAKDRWMQVLETSYLRDLLDRHAGNVSAAAKAAGIDRKTFHRLINKYRIRG
jgi:transcriptional regulator of acetoin/glycerol metabolism